MNKLPQITLAFWVMKICATTLGETAGDLLSMTLNVGYTISSIILLSFFIVTLFTQLFSKKFHPTIYWTVILATSTAGTTMSDFMDRTLGLGYATGSLILVSLLLATLALWKMKEKSLSVTAINTRRGEVFYWIAILFSNTLGTALGDFLADSSGLGFSGGAFLIGSLILVVVLLYYFTKISHVLLFWLAFVLTRPFGATFGDLLTKPIASGGLNFGTIGSSAILFGILIILLIFSIIKLHKKELESEISIKILILTLALLCNSNIYAGPPFNTDDPEPADLHHWEFYFSSANVITKNEAEGTAPHFDINYGAFENAHLHIMIPINYDYDMKRDFQYSYSNTEIGIKYRFLEEGKNYPQIGTFPAVEVPKSFKSNEFQLFLPLWLQKSFGKFTTYGGVGYWITGGKDNKNWTFAGWQVQYQFSEKLAQGLELIYHSKQTSDDLEQFALNYGGSYNYNENYHLLLSVGHSITGAKSFLAYSGLLITI